DASGRRRLKADHLPQERGFAAARTADDAEPLAALDGEIDVLEDDSVAVAHVHVLEEDRGLGVAHQKPTSSNSTANAASIRMTSVIATTTARVVWAPRSRVFGLMRSPKYAAVRPTAAPNTNPLPTPIQRLAIGTRSGISARTNAGPRPSVT